MKNNWWKIAVVVLLVVAVGVVIAGKNAGKNEDSASAPVVSPETVSVKPDTPTEPAIPEKKPIVEEQQPAKPSEPTAESSKTQTIKQQKPDKPAQKVVAKKAPTKLPKLVDLGATKCIPCKMMAPILEELAKEYKGELEVQFIDVWENQKAGQEYGIRAIPTQIFYDAKGKEFFRHEGFFAKEDILAKFKEQGIKLAK